MGRILDQLDDETLAVIVLNVGDGDAIIIRFPPEHGQRACAVVDCYNARKTIDALRLLNPDTVPFICATHPHYDHTRGLLDLIEWCIGEGITVEQFWDSGFRHVSQTHYNLIRFLQDQTDIDFMQPTSGFETTINMVRVLVLSPSIMLKNRYDTFGTNINNGSIVIKLEYPPNDIAVPYLSFEDAMEEGLAEEERMRQNTVILGGDAQFDAWARITTEFPELQRTENRAQMIDPDVIRHRPLRCQVLKIPHHMSKHGISLEVLETLRPRFALASCSSNSRHGFPHELTVMAAQDIHRREQDSGIRFTGHRNPNRRSGTIGIMCHGNQRQPIVECLQESTAANAPL